MDRMLMTDDEIYRCEHYAAAADAELRYQEMCAQDAYLAELQADADTVERAYWQRGSQRRYVTRLW
jgi:hypothetical protein